MKIIKSNKPCTYSVECNSLLKDGIDGTHCKKCKQYGDHDFKQGIENRFFNPNIHTLVVDCNKSYRR